MTYGWAGTILRIDLSKMKVTKQPFPLEWRVRFLGGSGVNDWILWNEVGPDVGPLSPDNRLIFGTGPLTGTILPLGSKTRVTTRSPLTGIFGDSSGGGLWSSELKYAGYDHIVVSGKAKEPVYVFIDDDDVEIRDATNLWGHDVYETDDMIKEEMGSEEFRTASIGQAGENMVRFANVMFDRYRAAAKAGAGCVMGSKNLKAIAVRGSKGVKIAKPKEVERISEEIGSSLNLNLSPGIAYFAKYGTTFLCVFYNEIGCNSVRNYQDVIWEEASNLPDEFIEKYVIRNLSCSVGCTTHCSHWWKIRDGRYAGETGANPEYIVMESLGIHLGVSDLRAILHFQNMVNRYGLDATETGTGIGLLMELWQRNIITGDDTHGVPYNWGDVKVIEDTIENIAFRKDIGDLLADGTVNAAKKMGRGAEKYVCHSKGLTEVEDVRPHPHWALAYAISTRGADHLKAHCQIDKHGRTDVSERLFGTPDVGYALSPKNKAKSVKYHEDFWAIVNSLGVCAFHPLSLMLKKDPKRALGIEDYAKIFVSVTGVEMSQEDFVKCGERIVCLEKAYNARLGISRKDDTLHGRWMWEPCPSGPGKGMKAEDYLEACLDEYYVERGFDVETGLPTKEKLEVLGLKEVSKWLERR